MAAEQSELELRCFLRRDGLGDETPEPRIDAVGVLPDAPLEEGTRSERPFAPSRSEDDGSSVDGDVPDIGDREVVARQLDRGRHGASLVGWSATPAPVGFALGRVRSRSPQPAPRGRSPAPDRFLSRTSPTDAPNSGQPQIERPGRTPGMGERDALKSRYRETSADWADSMGRCNTS